MTDQTEKKQEESPVETAKEIIQSVVTPDILKGHMTDITTQVLTKLTTSLSEILLDPKKAMTTQLLQLVLLLLIIIILFVKP